MIENSSNSQIEYQLNLLKKQNPQPLVIELNKTVNDQFLGLEQQKSYTFTINEMTTLKLEQLSLNSSSNNYKLVNSKGLEVILNNNNYLLIADTYYLTVVNDSQPNDRANPFSFKTVAVNKSIDLNLNILTQISYNQGIPDKFLKIYLCEDRLYDLSRNNYQHGGFVIYDLQGNYIKTIEPSYYNYGVGFEVNQTGNYLIRPTSYSDYSGSISFTLTDKAKYLNLAESDFVSGILNTYNSQQKYKIKIENQSLYKVNGNNSNIVFSIKKKDGAGNVYETPLNGGGYFSLESGEYEITLTNTSSSSSGYYLQILDLLKPNNNELQLNQKITLNSEYGQKANLQNLNGQAGETWLIDIRNTGANYHEVLWELYDPSGKRVISSSQSGSQDNAFKYTLTQSGQYTLLIWSYSSNLARTTSVLVTQPVDVKQTLNIGDQVSSQIVKAGDVHTYTLRLDKPTAFILDAVLGNTNFSIIREDGTIIDTNSYSVQYLTAGNYRFIFSGNRSDTPTYSFKLVDYIAKSSVVNHVENISSELKVGENLAFIELNTEPNQKYSLDFTTSTGLWYQIVDAYGRILISGNDYNNSNTFIAPNDQAYLIIRRASGSAVNAFNVQVVPVLNTVSVLPLGQTANVSMSKLADWAEYTFSMASEGWLVLENIASSDMGITLALRNQNNSQIFSHNNLTFANGLARIYLAAGHYTLSVNSNSDQAATLQFDARIDHIGAYSNVGQTLNTAQELFLKNGQTEINLLQPVTNQPYLYRFILNQGDSFNAILSEAQAGQIRLLDSSGNEVVKGAAGSIQHNATLTGIYYLELKNSTAGTQHITLNRSKGNLTESTDVGNTFATAKELSFKTDTQFKITTTIGDGPNATKDVDLYQIMLVAGEYLNISSYTNSNFLTRIFDSAGNAVYSTSYGGDGYYYYKAITTGVYYIGLSGNLNNSYNPLTGENVKDAYTGNNTVVLSRQSGLIRPITQFSEEINIPESMTSTENWSGIINTGSSQEFYFEVKSDGLYYLDRIQSTYNSSYNYNVSVLDTQSRVVGTGFNVAYYLKAGVYKYIVNNASYAENFQFKWMNLFAQATVIQQGQSVTLNYSKNATANRVYKFYAETGQTIQFNSLGQVSGTVPPYRIVNEFGQAVTENNLSSSQDGLLISLKHSGYYYIVFDDTSNGYNSEYYQYSGSVSFQVDSIDLRNIPQLHLNDKKSGILNAASQEVTYDLKIDKKSTILFDLLTATDSNLLFTIIDRSGNTVFSDYSNNLINSRLLSLNAGTYRVKVQTASFSQQVYGFKLLDLTQAQQLSSGQIVEDRLKPEGELSAYQITANAGDRIFIDFDELIAQSYNYYNGQWKQNYTTQLIVIDPYGRQQVISRNDINNLGSEFVVTVSGVYTILFDELNRDDIELPFRMAVYVHAPSNPVVIDLENNASRVDLSINELKVRSTDGDMIKSGSQLEISWTATNIGNSNSFGDFTDRVLIKNKSTGEIIAESLVLYSEQSSGALLVNQSINRTVLIKLPEGRLGVGDFEIIVEADFYNQQKETSESRKNNQAVISFSSEFRNYPNLSVDHITLTPAHNWQSGDSVTLNWDVKNSGQAPASGSWIERVEIINITTGSIVVAQDILMSAQSLAQNSEIKRQFNFVWPSDIYAIGQFLIKVKVDALNSIPEFSQDGSLENDNEARIEVIAGPDLVVKNLQFLQSKIQAGDLVTAVWQDVNQGSVATPTNYQDRLTVRTKNPDGSAGKVILNFAVAFNGQDALPILAGEIRNRSFSFTMPEGVDGIGQFIIEVTADSNIAGQGIVYEVNSVGNAEANNSLAATFSSTAQTYADLSVSQVIVPTNVGAGNTAKIQWTVTNSGDEAAEGQWVDRIILSRDAIIGNADDIILANYNRVKNLAVGESYQQDISLTIPPRLQGSYYIAVVTDVNQNIKEPDTRANNQVISAQFNIIKTYADLSPEIVQLPTVLGRNELGRVSWKVSNNGNLTTDINRWVDTVYISTKSTFDSSATVLGSVTRTGALTVGESYQAYLDFSLNGNLGQYYLFVKTDSYGAAYEPEHTQNNIVVSQPIVLEGEKLPDLQISDVQVQTQWQSGNQVKLTYTLNNTGTADFTGLVYDRVRLINSNNPSQIYNLSISPTSFNRAIAKGEKFVQEVWVNVPNIALGQWKLEVTSDVHNYVRELDVVSHTANTVIEMVSPDLVVGNLKTTGVLQGGQNIDISWTTYNQGSAKAAQVKDIVYLSLDDAIDGSDIKIGEVLHTEIGSSSSISSVLNYKIPQHLSGHWRLIIVTDASNKNAEYNAEDNNQYSQSLEIAKAEYADLVVKNISVPTQTIADPATLKVEWTVSNIGTGVGLNTTWTDTVIYSSDDILGNSDDIVLAKVIHDGALEKDASYTSSVQYRFGPNFTKHGYIFVQTDSLKQVWENDLEANNTAKSDHIVDVMPKAYADLQVNSLSIDNTQQLISGSTTTVKWSVSNQGIGITDKDTWVDRIWLSSQADGKGQIWELGSIQHLGYLAANQGYEHSLAITLPNGLSGTYYINMSTNTGNSVFEFIYGDNNQKLGLTTQVQLAEYPDLIVENITLPETAYEGTEVEFSWSVRNQSGKNATGSWIDSVRLISLDGSKSPIYLGNYSYTQGLEIGKTYTRTEKVGLPSRLEGAWRLEVVTNADLGKNTNSQIYEHAAARLNNRLISDDILRVDLNPRPDLRVTKIEAPEKIIAGGKGSVKFTVSNMGPLVTSSQWKDSVYLSLDGKLSSDDMLIGRYDSGSALAPTQSYTTITDEFTVPLRYRGDVYIIVVSDSGNSIDEYPNENNNIRVEKLYVEPTPFADIVTSDVIAPDQASHGSKITVDYKVSNKGSAKTQGDQSSINSWIDSVWLTVDKRQPDPSKGDKKLGDIRHTGLLDVGEDYLGQITVTIPEGTYSGRYYITVWSDTYDAILEDTLATNINLDDPTQVDNNNYKARAIDILGFSPPDFTVVDIQAPVQAVAGGSYQFSYTVKNRADEFEGTWTDEVWLADNTDLSKATIRWKLGEFIQTRKLGYNETYTVEQVIPLLAPSVTGLQLVVQTNSKQLKDTNDKVKQEKVKENNTAAVASSVTASASDLVATKVIVDPQVFSGETVNVSWTIENKGADVWTGTRSWMDYIVISAYPEYRPEYSTLIGSVEHSNAQGLKSGASYTTTGQFSIPAGYDGQYYIYVFSDAALSLGGKPFIPLDALNGTDNKFILESYQKAVFENNLIQNNVISTSFNVVYREPDLVIQDVQISNSNPNSGETVTVTWTVKNTGTRDTRVKSWYDGVYLSIDNTLDASDYPVIDRGEYTEIAGKVKLVVLEDVLKVGETYTRSATFTVPAAIGGHFNLIIKADTNYFNA
ncbi:CARDB domain-containing protein [Acinetobacter proteolyticus]|nr:CARDB domain-containing protein [Acinetobacter proteolyticus]WEI17182.1 CARDB domain-containing protein [Acinetobacter proteolyticus]